MNPGPGEGLDLDIAPVEVGVWICGLCLGLLRLLDFRCDDIGPVVLNDSFNLHLWAVVPLVPTAIYEARDLHHDLNSVA